jgi:multisubunit Na+/H+ antiporter MnhF subunit
MNPWLLTALVVLLCMAGPFAICARGDAIHRLVGLEAGSNMAIVILLLLAIGFNRDFLTDLALALALLSLGAGLLFARFLERWF